VILPGSVLRLQSLPYRCGEGSDLLVLGEGEKKEQVTAKKPTIGRSRPTDKGPSIWYWTAGAGKTQLLARRYDARGRIGTGTLC